MKKGKVYLIPNLLTPEDSWLNVIPNNVREQVSAMRCFAVENLREARRYLRKLDREFDIDGSTFHSLDKRTRPEELEIILNDVLAGKDLGILSDAGCPGIADPGSSLVEMAHNKGIQVVPFVGQSSILLALMASGMSGQHFKFHGYLPKGQKDRILALKNMELLAVRHNESQIFMDTPFRNEHVIQDVLQHCSDGTRFCIASNITAPDEYIKTKTIADWKKNALPNTHKKPCMFILGR